ncbi:MAG TPA: PKD domain-containing protein [Kofleriaceae bacterium]|nr:PKD domain-containing protein [Kofleriaceae bacterium]
MRLTVRRLLRCAFAAACGAMVLTASRSAEAQNLRVIPVPWVATDVTIPHQAYNGHATTFKAIARGGNGSYTVDWDFNGDGVYDSSTMTNNRYNLSARFTLPNQAATTTFNARVRVTSNGQTVTATYPVRVFADVPADPGNANDRQLQVMRGIAVDDALWYLHNQMSRTGSEDDPVAGAQISGNPQAQTTAGAAGFLWSLGLTGHYAAWPAAYIGQLPDAADNTQRFRDDPYAEDATRLINYLLTQATIVGVSATDEANLHGFYPEVTEAPIQGTDDGVGIFIGAGPGDYQNYYMGQVLSAFAVAHLTGMTAQVGDTTRIVGRRFEFVIQQMVDALAWSQNEGGVVGSFGSTQNNNSDDLSYSLWAITGLWHADQFGHADGIIVPNIVKARLVQYVQSNMNGCPQGGTGGTFATSTNGTCDLTPSAAHTFVLGWVNANQFTNTDSRLAFPSYSGSITRGNLKTWYDSSQQFINAAFTQNLGDSQGFTEGFVLAGDFGRVDGKGCHYCMLHWQDAARSVDPEIVNFGNNNWFRLFSRYLIDNQASDGNWNWSAAVGTNTDANGGPVMRSAWAVLVLSPDAIPPLSVGTVSTNMAPEGTSIDFNGNASDPGTGNPTYTWAFGNGATADGKNVTYAYPDNGNFNATLTSTSVGGTSVDTIAVTITNVAPTTNAGPDKTVDEGTPLPMAMTFTDPGTADTWTFAWNFGDTTTSNAQNVNHTWADNGVYNVTARVTDDDGGTSQDVAVVTVNNVAPTITSTPGTAAQEAQQYAYTLTWTDPGTADTFTCTAPIKPAGSQLVGCQLVWTPDFSQAIGAAAPIRLCVADDDGGQACQDYTVTVTFLDSDGDGLPDSWEISNFGDTTSQDQFGDPDADGMNNLQEFTNVTDPLTYDGPDAPVPATPVCGGEIASLQTILTATNAVDPQGTPLAYQFQLFSDPGLTILVAETANPAGLIAEGAGTTSWAVPVNLLENTRYYWRVRAKDQFTFGPWSTPACAFFVNTVNEAPGIPRINSPAFGGQVNSFMPRLVVDNATDPDQDALHYQFQVFDDPALSHLSAQTPAAGVPEGAMGTTSWTVVGGNLMEDHFYYWRVRACDPDNLCGGYSASGQFFVTTTNAPPEPPSIVSPRNGIVVGELRPDLVILNADDADLDPLVYDWDLATDVAFSTIVDGAQNVAPQGSLNTTFTLAADLQEDHRYCWRVRADDGQAPSNYNIACFLVSEHNDPPTVPTLNNPSDNMGTTTTTPVFSWAPSSDPEGEPITYDIEVKDSGGTVIGSVMGVSGTVTSISTELQNRATYSWRARATDRSGASSEWSPSNTFDVSAQVDDPEVVVNGGGCLSVGAPGSGSLIPLGVGLLLLRRRRRR